MNWILKVRIETANKASYVYTTMAVLCPFRELVRVCLCYFWTNLNYMHVLSDLYMVSSIFAATIFSHRMKQKIIEWRLCCSA